MQKKGSGLGKRFNRCYERNQHHGCGKRILYRAGNLFDGYTQ